MRNLAWLLLSALGCCFAAWGAGPYPLRVGPDHRHLVDQSGAPFLVHGDAPWSIISGLTREEEEQYLENRRRRDSIPSSSTSSSTSFTDRSIAMARDLSRLPETSPRRTKSISSTPTGSSAKRPRKASRFSWRRFISAISEPMKAGWRRRLPTDRKNAWHGADMSASDTATLTISSG